MKKTFKFDSTPTGVINFAATDSAIPNSVDMEARTASFNIVTTTTGVNGNRILRGALDFADYLRNPVVYLEHRGWTREFPIATTLSLTEEDSGNRYEAKARFATKDANEKGDQTLHALNERILRAASIGIQEVGSEFIIEQSGALVFSKAILSEWSVVAQPEIPDAQVLSRENQGLPVHSGQLDEIVSFCREAATRLSEYNRIDFSGSILSQLSSIQLALNNHVAEYTARNTVPDNSVVEKFVTSALASALSRKIMEVHGIHISAESIFQQ